MLFRSQPACVVELANARGARMRVELNGQGLEGLAGVNYLGRSATIILAGGGGEVC